MELQYSEKQEVVMSWWRADSEYFDREAILCDGAVRSGKTLAMGISFFQWAMTCFCGKKFGICGKTIGSVRRNLLSAVRPWLEKDEMVWKEKRSENLLVVKWQEKENEFYLFGGKDESSADYIQGITLAGVLLDEAALMPRSFVEQALARCSETGSRIWFNCNPAGPRHWLYTEWIQEAEKRNCLRLHFTMEDNPGLTEQVRQRYRKLYSGVFYQRYILGLWVQAEGRVYDFFDSKMVGTAPEYCDKWYVSCDYGTVNPTSMGLWGRHGGVWYRVKEFYFDSRKEQRQMTDAEYAAALDKLAEGRKLTAVIVDPSAASFIEVLRRRGVPVKKAKNDVLSGIRLTADALKSGKIVICSGCGDCLREMDEYVWDLSSGSGDRVKKEHDHAMDDMRYFVSTVLGEYTGSAFVACAVQRRR
ncbi:MAG: PBSX family phage terminase large subunit [Oscillospiraceae bacterium]|nr:PBSX family phage terminase large subunit [Oscillospiraceae bacterium]